MNKQNILLAVVVFATIVLFRLMNIPNFNPVIALSMLCGAIITNRVLAFVIPVVAIFASDFALALNNADPSYMQYITSGDFLGMYLFYLVSVLVGATIAKRLSMTTSLVATVVSVAIFFIGSNFFTWYSTALYSKTIEGLGMCYIAGIPFIKAMLLSNLSFSVVAYLIYSKLVHRKLIHA